MKLEKEKSLLDELAEKTGCDYLSDVPGYVGSSSFHNGIGVLRDWPLSEWEEAAEYLTGRRPEFRNEQEAREYLLRANRIGNS